MSVTVNAVKHAHMLHSDLKSALKSKATHEMEYIEVSSVQLEPQFNSTQD